MALIEANAWNAIQTLWVATMHAIVAWLAVSVPTGLILYFIFVALLRRFWRTRRSVLGGETCADADRGIRLAASAKRTS